MMILSTYFQRLIGLVSFFCYFIAVTTCAQIQTTHAFSAVKSTSNESAPILSPIKNLVVNPKHINPNYTHRDGILIADLLSYIEKLYEGHQFFTTSTEFLLNKSQFGIAITEINSPNHVDGLLTVGGHNYIYALVNRPNSGLARMIEPHQKISFRSYVANTKTDEYEVKIKFRLWDLREREQLSPFSWYRIDKVGGTSPFSLAEQEVTFKISPKKPAQERPFWNKNKILKGIRINLDHNDSFQMSVRDILTGADGEIVLRDKGNRPLGLKFLNWNSPIGTFYYRYDTNGPWVELKGNQTYLYLGMSAEIKIDFDKTQTDRHSSIKIQGWNGLQSDRRVHLTKNTKEIKFIFD